MKRLFDIVISCALFVLLLPFLAIIALVIVIFDGRPILFTQYRIGLDGKPFLMHKFRTMQINTPNDIPTCQMVDPYSYITRLGKLLRRTSIDELPQLINVLKGDMSLIGPRPVVRTETELISKRLENGVYTVRPGVTGWAQVNGRDLVTLDEKLNYDIYYIQNRGMFLDIRIMLKTAWIVLFRHGIQEGQVNTRMPEDISQQTAQ